mgnify:CR=1 FL=1
MCLPSRATVPLPQHAGATVPPPQRAVTHPRCREITASYRQQGPGGPSNRNNWDPAQAMTSIFSSLVLALSPIWATLILTTVVSAYSIPTRSMEGTLRVQDVVLAEKVSSLLRLPLERGERAHDARPQQVQAAAAWSSRIAAWRSGGSFAISAAGSLRAARNALRCFSAKGAAPEYLVALSEEMVVAGCAIFSWRL